MSPEHRRRSRGLTKLHPPDIGPIRRTQGAPFTRADVGALLDLEDARDAAFAHALDHGLRAARRRPGSGSLPNVTGHVAESLVETLLADVGLMPAWHFEKGGVGVDLLMLTPGLDAVLAIEVKGTLRPGHWPTLTRRAPAQFSPAWLDRLGNAGMEQNGLAADDVYGLVALVNFAELETRWGATWDFATFEPLESPALLEPWIRRENKRR